MRSLVRAIKTYGDVEEYLRLFTSAVSRVSSQVYQPVALSPGNSPNHPIGGFLGARGDNFVHLAGIEGRAAVPCHCPGMFDVPEG
jgi:hypothetical protein